MKLCACCKIQKPFTDFFKDKSVKDGFCKRCKICMKEYFQEYYKNNKENISKTNKEYRENNKEKIKENAREYRENNKEKISESKKLWAIKNLEKVSEKRKKYYKENIEKIKETAKLYRLTNVDKVNASKAKYKADKIQATPAWLTKEQLEEMQDFYIICKMFQIYTGLNCHVDHIVPLKGKTVCGLHVPWNLQILEASENISKSNKLLDEDLH